MPKKPETTFSVAELQHIARRLQDASASINASIQTINLAGLESIDTTYGAETDRGLRGVENFANGLKDAIQTALAKRTGGSNGATRRRKSGAR